MKTEKENSFPNDAEKAVHVLVANLETFKGKYRWGKTIQIQKRFI